MAGRRGPSSRAAAVAAVVLLIAVSATVAIDRPGNVFGVNAREFDVTKDEREWFRILLAEPEYIIVGARDRAYNISLDNMVKTREIDFTLDEEGERNCRNNLRQYFQTDPTNLTAVSCNTFVRTAFRDGENLVLCASNGGFARCRELHHNASTGSWSNTLSQPVLIVGAPPFAPPFEWMNFTVLRTSEGLLFTGGSMIDLQRRMLHAVYRNGSAHDDSLKPMLSYRRTEMTVHALKTYVNEEPVDSRIYPNFIATFETNEHVYWVFSEPALESQPFQYVGTSRVARVCKNDMSHPYVPKNDYIGSLSTFVTYWKATLECSVPGQHSGFGAYSYDRLGYNSFSFSTVAGASPLHSGSIMPRRDNETTNRIMYAVFNTDRNSIRGSALCAYSYQAIEQPFSGPLYVLQAQDPLLASHKSNDWSWQLIDLSSPHMRDRHHPAKCINDTRQIDDNSIYPAQAMLANKVQPITSKPLFIQTDHRYLMTHIVVDWQVRALDGRYYDVLFIATDHGELLKMVNIGYGDKVNYTIIENCTILPPGQTTGEMRMMEAVPGKRERQLLVNTFETIRLVPLERCSKQTSCSACVGLRDPYCSWSSIYSSCVAIYNGSQPELHYQNVVDGVHEKCPTTTAADGDVNSLDHAVIAGKSNQQIDSQVSDPVPSRVPLSDRSVSPVVHDASRGAVVNEPYQTLGSAAAMAAVDTTSSLPSAFGRPFVSQNYADDDRRVSTGDRGRVAAAPAAEATEPQYSATFLAMACCIACALSLIMGFLGGWCASKRCDVLKRKVPRHLQNGSVKDFDDLSTVHHPNKGVPEEPRYGTYPTKSNNLTPNKLNNTRATANEVCLSATDKKPKAEYV